MSETPGLMFDVPVPAGLQREHYTTHTAAVVLLAMKCSQCIVAAALVTLSPQGNNRVLGFAGAPGVVQLRHQPAVNARQAPCCGQRHGRDYR